MKHIKKIISKGMKDLESDVIKFEKEYSNTSQDIEKKRKEMEEWSHKRKIIRNK